MLYDSLPVGTPANLRILVNFPNIRNDIYPNPTTVFRNDCPPEANSTRARGCRVTTSGMSGVAGRSVLQYLDCAVRRGLKFYSSPRAPRTFSGMSGVALARLLAGLAFRIRVLFLTSKSVAILCRSRMLYLKQGVPRNSIKIKAKRKYKNQSEKSDLAHLGEISEANYNNTKIGKITQKMQKCA